MSEDWFANLIGYIPYVLGGIFGLGIIGTLISHGYENRKQREKQRKQEIDISEFEKNLRTYSPEEVLVARLMICEKYEQVPTHATISNTAKMLNISNYRLSELEDLVYRDENQQNL
jgi:hypothetical protein